MTTTSWIILIVIFAVCFTGSLVFTLFSIKKGVKKGKKDKE